MILKMTEPKATKLNIREDRPTAISSSAHGSNLDAIGFNVLFLATRDPKLAIEILKLYALAHKVGENDPKAPEEDFALFADELRKILSETSED